METKRRLIYILEVVPFIKFTKNRVFQKVHIFGGKSYSFHKFF